MHHTIMLHRKQVCIRFLFALLWSSVCIGSLAVSANQGIYADPSAESGAVRMLSQIGGATVTVYVAGDKAYIGEGARVVILDVTQPTAPVLLGQSEILEGIVKDIVVQNKIAFVAAGPAGFYIIDVSIAAAPTILGHIDTSGKFDGIFLQGQFAYLADEHGGVRIIDVADPASAVEVGRFDESIFARNLYVVGPYVYVADLYVGLRILDVADPKAPFEVGRLETLDTPVDVHVAGNYAYITNKSTGIHIIEISDPSAPKPVAMLPVNNPYNVDIAGNTAYVVNEGNTLHLIDITNPMVPRLISTIKETGAAIDVHISGQLAFVANNYGGLSVISVSTPKSPLRVGTYTAVGRVFQLDAVADYIYLATTPNHLQIVRVTDPTAPTSEGFLNLPDYIFGIDVVDSRAYIANYAQGLRVVDISNPSMPQEVDFVDTPGRARSVQVVGTIAYVADWDGGLRIIDVSSMTEPYEIGATPSITLANNLDVVDNHVYVANREMGLSIVDVTAPVAPKQIGRIDTAGTTYDVAVVGDYAYLADDGGGLGVVDVRNPASPKLAALLSIEGGPIAIDIHENFAFLAVKTQGLRVVDIANPLAPREIASFDTPGYTSDVQFADGVVYLADDTGGLYTVQFPACYQLTARYGGLGATPQVEPPSSAGCPPGQYFFNEVISLQGQPAAEWRVKRWVGSSNDTSSASTNLLTMPAADHEVLVHYELIAPCYPLTLTHQGEGNSPVAIPTGSPGCPNSHYTSGAAITLHAKPAAGQQIAAWQGATDGDSTSPNSTLIMPANAHTVSVIYMAPAAPVQGDLYEEDNSCTAAQLISTDGVNQSHTLHQPGDEDWLKFDAVAGTRYRIEVAPTVHSLVNPLLEVYRSCGSPPSETRKTLSAGIRYDVNVSATGLVYLRLADIDPQTGDNTAGYAVSVRPVMHVTDAPAPAPDALILVAGRYRVGDEVQPNINQVAQAVYDYYLDMNYRADQIYYLTTDSSRNGYDGHPTLENLDQAITTWAPQVLGSDGALTLYLIDHGNADALYLDNTGERKHILTPGQLSAWLEELEARIPNIKITIIIEACNSGSFIEGADSLSKDRTQRLVITSTNPENVAYASQHGAHFSDFFVAALKQGYSLQNSFRSAFVVVQELSSDWEDIQEPWIDANANGIANEEADITLLSRGIPGQRDIKSDNEGPPRIVTAQLRGSVENQQVGIDAIVSDDNQVKRVWAVIYPPSFQPPTSSTELVPGSLRTVELQSVGTNQSDEGISAQFAGILDNLTEAGQYRIAVYAEDEAEFTAVPVLIGFDTTNENQLYLPLIIH